LKGTIGPNQSNERHLFDGGLNEFAIEKSFALKRGSHKFRMKKGQMFESGRSKGEVGASATFKRDMLERMKGDFIKFAIDKLDMLE
tara:strand:- start:4 stop:261 length:258 start_codon:yes stop_codon:yes gene_type:complete